MTRTIVARADDGSEVLVTLRSGEDAEVSQRGGPGDIWGIPLEIIVDEEDPE